MPKTLTATPFRKFGSNCLDNAARRDGNWAAYAGDKMKAYHFGTIEVQKLVEIERMAVEGDWLLGNLTPELLDEHRAWLGPNLVEPGSNRVFLSFHSYVIRTPTLNILIDTCNGNHKQRPTMPAWHMLDLPYLEHLNAIGLAPSDIDIVMCTHLHADHVGWNTRLENGRWVPTFPKARYLMSRVDYEYFDALHNANPSTPVNRGSFIDSVLPVIESGQAVLVNAGDVADAQLAKEIRLESAPGHSPGNLNIFLKAGGRSACLCGDVIHHAIQCAVPELCSPADADKAQGIATRRSLLERCADTDMVMLTGHFPDPTAGRIIRHAGSFRFRFDG
jgi:glyoxylase-like metal-dependent hydrolase (beta-lactamase superfamily II)